MTKLYRQGDVLFRVAKPPKGERKIRKDGIIMHGEATGHAHRIADLTSGEVYDIGERCFLSASPAGVSIVHDEHGPIVLPGGAYEVLRQREYSPEEIRNVAD